MQQTDKEAFEKEHPRPDEYNYPKNNGDLAFLTGLRKGWKTALEYERKNNYTRCGCPYIKLKCDGYKVTCDTHKISWPVLMSRVVTLQAKIENMEHKLCFASDRLSLVINKIEE